MLRRLFVVCRIVVVLVGLSALAATAQQPDASRFDAVVQTARQELADSRTPGAAIALVDGDRVVFATGIGVADVESRGAVATGMLFRLGSTTKMFTATALVTLAEEGKISLDAPIADTVGGLDPALARLTANQLLSHTAGLRDEAPMFGRQDDDALGAGIGAMKSAAVFTEPAAVYSYANPGFWIAGLLVERIVGKPYADAMQERVFAPLGMSRSTFRPMMAMTYPLAQGHEATEGKAPVIIRPAANNAATWPAGSMFSNVHDLSRFVIAFMNEGRLDGRQVIEPGVIAKLSSPHASIPGGTASYGYGLELSERGGVRLVGHGGSRAGYGSTIMMAPSRRAAAIVLGNRSGSGLPRTARRGMELLLGMPTGALDATPSPPATTTAATGDLNDWVGRYSQGGSNAIEIGMKDGHLVIRQQGRERIATRQGALRLSVAGDGTGGPATLILVPDRNGKPAYVFAGGRSFKRAPAGVR